MSVTFTHEDREFLIKPWIARMSVIDLHGYPHTIPVWYLLDGDAIWITSMKATKKVDYLLANSKGCIQIGGEPDQAGVAYIFKGDFTILPDDDHHLLRRITYHYEESQVADDHLRDWTKEVSVGLKFVPHTKVRFQV